MLYACDYAWWKQYAAEVSRVVTGERWTCSNRAAAEYTLTHVRGNPFKGASRQPDAINTGQNSGYQAIELARHWGAKRILLLGYDFGYSGGKKHWHGDHPSSMGNGGNFSLWSQSMAALAADLKTLGVEVVNCSRSTTLKCFPLSTIDKQLEGIK